MCIIVKNSGFFTTIQDAGRTGFQQYGVTASGAMDKLSFTLANILVNNDDNEAGLEITLIGPMLEFTQEAVIAITGADLQPRINNIDIEMYRAIKVNESDILTFGGVKYGSRAYLAVAGGFNIAPVMNSKSTNVKAHIGGLNGNKLETGDIIHLNSKYNDIPNLPFRTIDNGDLKIKSSNYTEIRVILGPQDNCFTEDGINTFLNSEYTVTNDFDRMGCRLDGNIIQHIGDGNIISDGIALGAVQVPANGKPIIMLADRQTTGGYTKIANVITVDLTKIAQSKPTDVFKFKEIDIYEAQRLYKEQFDLLKDIRNRLNEERKTAYNCKIYKIKVNGKTYDVKCEEIK